MKLALAVSLVAAIIGLLGGSTAHGSSYGCNLSIPTLAAAPGGGVAVGHVKGSCNFAWHSLNVVMYKDRWQGLGQRWLAGGAKDVQVVQPAYNSYYEECGKWKLRVKVYLGNQLVEIYDGPVSSFCS